MEGCETIKTIIKIITFVLLILLGGVEQTFASESDSQLFMNGSNIEKSYFVNDCANIINEDEEIELAKIGKTLFDKSKIRIIIMTTKSSVDNFQAALQGCVQTHNGHWKVNRQIDKNSIYLFVNVENGAYTTYLKAENEKLNKFYNKEDGLDEVINRIDISETSTKTVASQYFRLIANDFDYRINEQANKSQKEAISETKQEIVDVNEKIVKTSATHLFKKTIKYCIIIFPVLVAIFFIIKVLTFFYSLGYSIDDEMGDEIEVCKDPNYINSSKGENVEIPKINPIASNIKNNSFSLKRKIKKSVLYFEDININFDNIYTNLTSPLINKIETSEEGFSILLKNTFKEDIELEYNHKQVELLSSTRINDDTLYNFKLLSKKSRITLKAYDERFDRTASTQLEMIKPLLEIMNKTKYSASVNDSITVQLNINDFENTIIGFGNRNITYKLLEDGMIQIQSPVETKGRITIQDREYSGRIEINVTFTDTKKNTI